MQKQRRPTSKLMSDAFVSPFVYNPQFSSDCATLYGKSASHFSLVMSRFIFVMVTVKRHFVLFVSGMYYAVLFLSTYNWYEFIILCHTE